MRKHIAASFILSLVALFGFLVQSVPAVRSSVLRTAFTAHGAGPLVTAVADRSKPAIPSGPETYQITENSGAGPHIIQATIDPPDVHVGDLQKFTVIVSSAVEPSSVEAFVETDHGTTTVKLASMGLARAGDVLPARYALNEKGNVVPVSDIASNNDSNQLTRLINDVLGRPSVSSAATSSPAKQYRYEGSWTVRDTHNIYYHTTFVVKDIAGKTDTVTLAWSDACGIPQSGAWTIPANCTESSLDGVDRGNVTITNYTLTLNPGVQFVFTPGNTVTIGTGGSIVIGAGASLTKGYLYYHDADADGYPAAAALNFSTNASLAGYVLRGSETNYASIDCNDNVASVYKNWTEYRDADGDGYGVLTSSQGVCGGASQPAPDAGYTLSASADCYDANSSAYPGSAYGSAYQRGDNSFDYNCDGRDWPVLPFTNHRWTNGSGSSCTSFQYNFGSPFPMIGTSYSMTVTGVISNYTLDVAYNGPGAVCGTNVNTVVGFSNLGGTYPGCYVVATPGAAQRVACN